MSRAVALPISSVGELLVSPNVRNACRDLARHFQILTAMAGVFDSQYEKLPEDDFFKSQTVGMQEPLRLFLQDYVDSSEDSLHRGVPITVTGSRRDLLPMGAAAASFLFELGHEHVGIAVVAATGRGVVFQFCSREDVVCRTVEEMRLAGGVS